MHYQAGPFFLNTFDFHKNFPNTNFEEKSGFAQFSWQLLDLSFHANATAICRKISRISPEEETRGLSSFSRKKTAKYFLQMDSLILDGNGLPLRPFCNGETKQ